jgi:ABC-type nickel/cobalt efflux system permease component RcnA
MNMQTMALILVLLLLAWFFVRRRQATSNDKSQPAARTSNKNTAYHAVSIKFTGNACKAAREMEGQRILSSAAPRLPLPDCDAIDCGCRFAHHPDRRAKQDRRSPFGPGGLGGSTGKYAQEQRQGKDRRQSDDEDFF